jgi:uncharacterized RDD family membrane protein YckC
VSEHDISAVPREARPYQGASAGLVTRLLANTIDVVAVGVALGGCYVGFAAFVFMLDPVAFELPTAGVLLSITAAMGLSVVYLTLAWWLTGKTYGDHVMGLRVVGRRGRRLGPVRSLGRAAFCVFFPIGLFWCAVSPERRSVQDLVLWTRVVYDWSPGGHEHGPGRADAGEEERGPATGERPPVTGDATVLGRPRDSSDARPRDPSDT